MKKLFSVFCITLCLLFSGAVATSVRADDGDGHDPGYVCVETETVDCSPNGEPPPPSVTFDSSTGAAEAEEDTFLTLLEMITTLLP